MIVAEVGYNGQLIFDTTKPDGTQKKLMDINKIINLGWNPSINLNEGIKKTIVEFKKKLNNDTK